MKPTPALHIVLYSAFPSSSGGRENWVYHLASATRHAFREVIVYSFNDDGAPYFPLDAAGIESVRVPSLQHTVQWRPDPVSRTVHKVATLLDLVSVFPARAGRQLARRVRPGDIILAMNSVTEMRAALRANHLSGHDTITLCSVRGHVVEELSAMSRVPGATRIFRALERRGLLAADGILSNGEDTRAYLAERGYASRVVPNGVDVRRFAAGSVANAPDVLRRLRADGVWVVCIVGSLRQIKGTSDVIRAIPAFRRHTTRPTRFVFIGNGDPESFRRLAGDLSVDSALVFLGEQPGVEHCLAAADCAACVSYGAGMSMAALECMAAGKPIVAWDSAVYRQMLTDGVTARLVPEGDVEALGASLATLASDSHGAARLGQMAATGARQYDWSVVGQRFLAEIDAAMMKSP